MTPGTSHKKRSYSLIYVIYRRIRFVRYKKRLAIRTRLEIKEKAEKERKELEVKLKEFNLEEKRNRQIKLKAEREEGRRLKKELRDELRQRDRLAKQEWGALTLEEKKKQKLVHKQVRNERKKERRQNLRFRSKQFVRFLRSINLTNLKRNVRTFRENAPKRRRLLLISFNSTILFLLSYLTLFLVSQASTVLAARFFNYPTTVYYYEIYFNISQESWFHDSVKTIFSAGPIVNFVIGISFLIIYSNIKELNGVFKLYFLWGFLHAVNMLFGALLIGTLFDTGVGHVISWLYIMDTGKVLYSILSIFLLVIAGLIATKPFLISGNSYYNEVNFFNRNSFIIAQVLVPFLLGNVIMYIIRQPRFVFYDTFISVTLIVCLLPVLVTYSTYNDLYFEEEDKHPKPAWIPLLVLGLFVMIFRGLLELGLRFGG